MRCSTFLEDDAFVLCVEEVDPVLVPVVERAFFKREGDRFVKRYPASVQDQAKIAANFPRLAQAMFSGENADWETALETFADRCADTGIEWYATGSVCDALRGIAITPHDLDLVTHTRSFWMARDLFREEMIEPFVDNGGTWVVWYFGRVCLASIQLDIVADPSRDAEVHPYERVEWRGHRIPVEPFETRYRTEIQRGRHDRIAAFDAFLRDHPAGTTGTT
jgi:hypothetical protein